MTKVPFVKFESDYVQNDIPVSSHLAITHASIWQVIHEMPFGTGVSLMIPGELGISANVTKCSVSV